MSLVGRLLSLSVLLWASLPGVSAAADADCSPERLAEVYPEVRQQYDLLREGTDASVTWSPAHEAALFEMRGCPDAIGRRASFYFAITQLIRGDIEGSRQLVEELDGALLPENERRQADELRQLVARAQAELDAEPTRRKEAAQPARSRRIATGTIVGAGATAAALGSGFNFAGVSAIRTEAETTLHSTAEADALIARGNGHVVAGVGLAAAAMIAASVAIGTLASAKSLEDSVAVAPIPLPGGFGFVVGGQW
jgi:hypothetical protein